MPDVWKTRREGDSDLKRTVFLISTLTLVALMMAVSMAWVRNSQTRTIHEGAVLLSLWGTHGVHELDVIVLGIEMILGTMLVLVLIAGFRRG